MNKRNIGKKLEIWGLAVLLIATGFQLFVVDTLVSGKEEAHFLRIEEKLDSTFFVLADMYSNSKDNISETSVKTNFSLHVNEWKDWDDGMQRIKSQRAGLSIIGGLVFLLGSFLILIGKIISLKESK